MSAIKIDVRATRKKLGLNQQQFWSRIGITQSGGSRYETGRNIPGPVGLMLQLVYGPTAQSVRLLDKLRKGDATKK